MIIPFGRVNWQINCVNRTIIADREKCRNPLRIGLFVLSDVIEDVSSLLRTEFRFMCFY